MASRRHGRQGSAAKRSSSGSVAATAIAASVSLVVLLRLGNINGSGDDGMRQANSTAVDKAYENLSQQERENLLADYKNDIYMSLQ